jgi:hypothetical protein
MPFFVAIPISKIVPINEKRLSVLPVIQSAPSAPTAATGTEKRMMKGAR